MVIFFNRGRVGNQLFQYCALRGLFQNQKLFLFGFESLDEFFEGVDASIVKPHKLGIGRLLQDGFHNLVKFLAAVRVVTYCRETAENGRLNLASRKGILAFINFVDESYFQTENLMPGSVVDKLQIKESFLQSAQRCLDKVTEPGQEPYFVHVRRTDYLSFPTAHAPAVLPFQWYNTAMETIRAQTASAFFVITTDDTSYAEEKFREFSNVWVSHESEYIDFAIMSLCSGGVLSASSFAWWAGNLAKTNHAVGPFVAPHYWCGHRMGEWYPSAIKTDWMTYLQVHSNHAAPPSKKLDSSY